METNTSAELELWTSDLQVFSIRLGLTRPPEFIVKRSRFKPLLPISAWGRMPGVWAGLNRIIISAPLLHATDERRRYLLAHELGHIKRKHSRRGPTLSAGAVLTLLPLYLHLQFLFALRVADALLFFVCAILLARQVSGFKEEFEADEVAAQLIGVDGVEKGIRDMASVEGMTPKRKARLAALPQLRTKLRR